MPGGAGCRPAWLNGAFQHCWDVRHQRSNQLNADPRRSEMKRLKTDFGCGEAAIAPQLATSRQLHRTCEFSTILRQVHLPYLETRLTSVLTQFHLSMKIRR